jgi:hypothetical protein
MITVTFNKRSLLASLGLAAVLAGLLIAATASAAAPPHRMTLEEACALPEARCFPLPSGAGVWTMLIEAEGTAPGSASPALRGASPDLRPADALREACARADARCFPLPSGSGR